MVSEPQLVFMSYVVVIVICMGFGLLFTLCFVDLAFASRQLQPSIDRSSLFPWKTIDKIEETVDHFEKSPKMVDGHLEAINHSEQNP